MIHCSSWWSTITLLPNSATRSNQCSVIELVRIEFSCRSLSVCWQRWPSNRRLEARTQTVLIAFVFVHRNNIKQPRLLNPEAKVSVDAKRQPQHNHRGHDVDPVPTVSDFLAVNRIVSQTVNFFRVRGGSCPRHQQHDRNYNTKQDSRRVQKVKIGYADQPASQR